MQLCPYIAAELVDLVNELQQVNNWIPFGLNLGIDISRLEAIENERATIEERRTQLLICWRRQVVPTWSAVVKALMAIGMRHLASKIAQKYGKYVLMDQSCMCMHVVMVIRNCDQFAIDYIFEQVATALPVAGSTLTFLDTSVCIHQLMLKCRSKR